MALLKQMTRTPGGLSATAVAELVAYCLKIVALVTIDDLKE